MAFRLAVLHKSPGLSVASMICNYLHPASGLIDQDRIRLIDDSEVTLTLDAVARSGHHVIFQIVESKSCVGAVSNVRIFISTPAASRPGQSRTNSNGPEN